MEGKKEKLEELKAQHEAFKMFFDMLAETGEPRFIFQKKWVDFRDKLSELALDDKITNQQFERLSSLIDQFVDFVDGVLKEES